MPLQYQVRPATPEDETAVSAVLEASYGALMPSGYDAETLAAVLPVMAKANPTLLASGTYYVADAAGQGIVGCGGWSRERPGTGETEAGRAHIRHFGTHPDWLGRSVGRAIFQACLDDARAAGIRRFECYSSLNAEGFYAALGFEAVRRTTIPMGAGTEMATVVMERGVP